MLPTQNREQRTEQSRVPYCSLRRTEYSGQNSHDVATAPKQNREQRTGQSTSPYCSPRKTENSGQNSQQLTTALNAEKITAYRTVNGSLLIPMQNREQRTERSTASYCSLCRTKNSGQNSQQLPTALYAEQKTADRKLPRKNQ